MVFETENVKLCSVSHNKSGSSPSVTASVRAGNGLTTIEVLRLTLHTRALMTIPLVDISRASSYSDGNESLCRGMPIRRIPILCSEWRPQIE